MRKSERLITQQIRLILKEIFIDGKEYCSTSFKKDYILAYVQRKFSKIKWLSIYNLFNGDWRDFRDGFYSEYIDINFYDTREKCEEKYQYALEQARQKLLFPLVRDYDIKEYRIPLTLEDFENLGGDIFHTKGKGIDSYGHSFSLLGAKLPSKTEARHHIQEFDKVKKLLEKKKEEKNNGMSL